MSEERLEKMRAALDKPQVLLQKYNILRTRHAGKWICAFEGHEDVAFYDVLFDKVGVQFNHVPFVCLGKDYVLQLRQVLSRNTSQDSQLVRYFVDRDFDGLKGHEPGEDVYVTPCYSFENLLVNVTVLKKLMQSEFRCNAEDAAEDIEKIENLFAERLSEFISSIRQANFLLHAARSQGIKLNNADNELSKYVRISLSCVKSNGTQAEVAKLLGYATEPDESMLAASKPAFDKLDPQLDWRGKFIFAFFRKFLALLKDDRGGRSPKYFNSRANMDFNSNGDIIRSLASMITVPDCLRNFISRMVVSQST